MPGAVGRTSTFALCNVTLPWALQIANRGLLAAAEALPPVARAINIYEGEVTNRAVAETFGMKYNPRFEKYRSGQWSVVTGGIDNFHATDH